MESEREQLGSNLIWLNQTSWKKKGKEREHLLLENRLRHGRLRQPLRLHKDAAVIWAGKVADAGDGAVIFAIRRGQLDANPLAWRKFGVADEANDARP